MITAKGEKSRAFACGCERHVSRSPTTVGEARPSQPPCCAEFEACVVGGWRTILQDRAESPRPHHDARKFGIRLWIFDARRHDGTRRVRGER